MLGDEDEATIATPKAEPHLVKVPTMRRSGLGLEAGRFDGLTRSGELVELVGFDTLAKCEEGEEGGVVVVPVEDVASRRHIIP